MAVATESFSIREYAGKMRGVDYDKCWPFEAERGGRSLPPMSVRMFRWWVDELRAVRSVAEADGRADPGMKSGAQVEAADAQEDATGGLTATGRAGQREASVEKVRTPSSRAKQRMPKKRSIMELFAVAPPIREAHEKDQRDVGGYIVNLQGAAPAAAADGDFGILGGRDLFELRTKGKLGKDGGKMRKEKIGVNKKLKAKTKQMKKKKHKVEIRAAKKENVCNLKMSCSTDICKILKSRACGKQVSNVQKRFDHKQTNPATIGNLLKKHIFRLLRTSKLVSRTQEVARVSPLNIGVGKWKRGVPSKKRKKLENTNGRDAIEQYNHSTKHLSSSGKDLSLGDGSFPVELPHLETLCKIVSDVLVASSTMEKLDRVSPEGCHVNLNDKETSLSLNRKGVNVTRTVESGETSSEILFDGCFTPLATENSSITKRSPIVQNLDLNNPVKDYVDLNCISMEGSTLIPSQTHSADQNVVGTREDLRLDSDCGTCQEQSFSLISDHMNSLHDHVGKNVSVLDTRNGVSMDSIEGKDGGIGVPEFQKIYHTPKDTVLSTGSSVNPKAIVEQSSFLRPIRRDKSTEEGFIGLPLNSQGELIHLDQGARYGDGVCEVDKMPKSALSFLQNFPASSHFQPQSNHILMKGKFPFISSYHDDGDENCLFEHHPARKVFLSDFSSAELQNLQKMNYQKYGGKAQLSGCDPKQMEYFSSGYRDPIASESCYERMKLGSDRDLELGTRTVIRPTMRLMGKNVTVGNYSKEYDGCIDGKLIADKEVANTSYPTITVYDKPICKRWHEHECILKAECKASKGIPLNTLEVPLNCCCILADKLTTNYTHPGFGSDWMLREGNSSISGDRGFRFDFIPSPVQCQSLPNRASRFAVNWNPEAHFVDMEQQRRLLTSNPHNLWQHILVNSSHCSQSQSQTVPYSIPSTSHSPYINQTSAQASRSQSIPKVSHWMQDSTSQHLHFPPYPTAVYQPCNIPANNGFPHVTPYPRPVVSLPSTSNTSPQTYGSFGPTSVVYRPSITALAAHNFVSSSTCYRDEMEAKDGMEIYFSHVTSQEYSQRYRKRSASNDGKFIETVKRCNVKVQGDSIRPGSVRRELLVREKDNLRGSELNACVDRTVDDSLPAVYSKKDSVAVSGGISRFKSGHTRLGPVKLSAGAKHILRPNGNLVQENCRTIYSTMPFNQGTSAGQDANPQEKAAKVHRF